MPNELIEVIPFDYQIVESVNGRLRVEGVFQRSDVENANKRVYPRKIWERQLNEKRVQEALSTRSMFGELDHPSDGKTKLSRVSHIITGLNLENDGVVTGAAEILEDTPNGKILKALFEAGTQVGISSRGSGSVNNSVVAEDFRLNTFDFVARPSTPGALPTPSTTSQRKSCREHAEEGVTVASIEDSGTFIDNSTEEYSGLDPELQSMLMSLEEDMEQSGETVQDLGREILELHNFLGQHVDAMPLEELEEASARVLDLGNRAYRLAEESPEDHIVTSDLINLIDESRDMVFGLTVPNTTQETVEEETMDRTEFIKSRLYEAAENAEDQQLLEAQDLAEELADLDDDELLNLGIQVGVVDPDDLEEADADYDEDPEAELLTDGDVVEFIDMLENRLDEATELIAELTGTLEESESDIAVKYEASLGILQETITQYQMLQEAIGGQDKADKILEAYANKLEKTVVDSTDYTPTEVTEDFDDIEALLGEVDDSSMSTTMARNKHLAESACARLNLQ